MFSTDFDTPILILIYATLILGGAGSIGGVILGGLLLSVLLEGSCAARPRPATCSTP